MNSKILCQVSSKITIDQLNETVYLPKKPIRIISLVPSITELLYQLNLGNEVVGITKFCIHPNEWFRTKNRIGGTKNINIKKVELLQPDLILANKEENVKEQVDALRKIAPVYVSDVNTFEDALHLIHSIGRMTQKKTKATQIVNKITKQFNLLHVDQHPKKVIYLIWQNPFITIGGDTFISTMLSKAGFDNMYKNKKRYPELSVEDIQKRKPDFLFLSSEPYPFKQKHLNALQTLFPHTKMVLVDGELFSWYGSKMQEAPQYFKKLYKELL